MLGTGFFTTQSIVITNWHVARDAKHISVTDCNNVTYDVTLRNSAPSTDLATIDVNGANSKLGLTNANDHPTGFELGITNGLQMRNQAEIDADNAIADKAKLNAALDQVTADSFTGSRNAQASGGPGSWLRN